MDRLIKVYGKTSVSNIIHVSYIRSQIETRMLSKSTASKFSDAIWHRVLRRLRSLSRKLTFSRLSVSIKGQVFTQHRSRLGLVNILILLNLAYNIIYSWLRLLPATKPWPHQPGIMFIAIGWSWYLSLPVACCFCSLHEVDLDQVPSRGWNRLVQLNIANESRDLIKIHLIAPTWPYIVLGGIQFSFIFYRQ